MVKDIYRKTNCAVKVEDGTTDFFKFTKGVRQGCPLSPILFNMYVDDIFEMVNTGNDTDIFLEEGKKVNALMYADDLILLSDTKEGLQKQIDKMGFYCDEWKLDVNIKKTKIMIFNRGNNLIKNEFRYKDVVLQNVKQFKYLGFSISAKNCSFSPTIDDLSLKANRAIFALNNKIKISKLPRRLALKLFNSQITPILLYGSEVWGPYMNYDYLSWELSKIERVQTQFLKRMLGCNIQTSNIMTRGEVGIRPLLLNVIKRVVGYTNSIKQRPNSTAYTAFIFESRNDVNPNFCTFVEKHDLNCINIHEKSKSMLTKICQDSYDRFWWEQINNSPKATSYVTFKRTVNYEKYLDQIENAKHKISLSRFRLSNHNLLIEKGRHMRPRLERNERKCFNCKEEVEDECHFVIECPLYTEERKLLFGCCKQNCKNFDSLTKEQKFIFIFTNESANVTKILAKFIFQSSKIRETSVSGS